MRMDSVGRVEFLLKEISERGADREGALGLPGAAGDGEVWTAAMTANLSRGATGAGIRLTGERRQKDELSIGLGGTYTSPHALRNGTSAPDADREDQFEEM